MLLNVHGNVIQWSQYLTLLNDRYPGVLAANYVCNASFEHVSNFGTLMRLNNYYLALQEISPLNDKQVAVIQTIRSKQVAILMTIKENLLLK